MRTANMWQYISMKSRDTIAATVGRNIRRLRLGRSQTLAGLAGQAGTSVRTLVEIESGRANASLATLGAIADALGVDFGRLTQAQEPGAVRTVRTADAAVAWGDGRGSEARLVLVSREPQSAELWRWLLKPGSHYQAKPDPEGTDVLIMVDRGTLTMTVAGRPSELSPGTAGHITAGAGYLLANHGRGDTAFTLVHIPPVATRARYTRAAGRSPDDA
jgi:transcriptional regulator with XRE-family HTH domain